jgi:hypothetical protein
MVLDYIDMESRWTIESRPTTSGNVCVKAVRYLDSRDDHFLR